MLSPVWVKTSKYLSLFLSSHPLPLCTRTSAYLVRTDEDSALQHACAGAHRVRQDFIAKGAVERQVRLALEPTPPHTTPRPFPRTRNPNRSPRTPLLPHFHTHSMAFACAAGEEKCLAYMIKKASRDVTFTSQDPTVDILFKPR